MPYQIGMPPLPPEPTEPLPPPPEDIPAPYEQPRQDYPQDSANGGGQYEVRNAICKVNGNKKVIDFRSCLSIADAAHAAGLHGQGGKSGRRSVIKMTICDYSRGTGNASVTADANLEPSACRLLLAVAEDRVKGGFCENRIMAAQNLRVALDGLRQAAAHGGNLTGNNLVEVGKAVKAASGALGLVPGPDYTYSVQKLNVYAPAGNGRFKATNFTISHQFLNGKDGKPSRYPWFISIDQGTAINKATDGRTVMGQYKSDRKVGINLTDIDMYMAMSKVVRAIDVWEEQIAGPQLARIEAQRQDWNRK
jgi:hypothetical protein